jgi:hypothetical protein
MDPANIQIPMDVDPPLSPSSWALLETQIVDAQHVAAANAVEAHTDGAAGKPPPVFVTVTPTRLPTNATVQAQLGIQESRIHAASLATLDGHIDPHGKPSEQGGSDGSCDTPETSPSPRKLRRILRRSSTTSSSDAERPGFWIGWPAFVLRLFLSFYRNLH